MAADTVRIPVVGLLAGMIGIAAVHAGTADLSAMHPSMIGIAAVLVAHAGTAEPSAVDLSVVDSSMSVVRTAYSAMEVFGETGLTDVAVGAEGLAADCIVERIDYLAGINADEGLAAVLRVLFASAMVVFVLVMMPRDPTVAFVKLVAVLLQAVLLHIVSLAVGGSPGIPALLLCLPVLISMPHLTCHCSLLCASPRYCLVLWPAEGDHCSTHIPAHLRAAEGCPLSTEAGSTGHIVCVCV